MGERANTSTIDDLAALKAVITGQRGTIAELREKIVRLEHNVEVFRRLAFGKLSEKRRPQTPQPEASGQGHLFVRELVEEAERVASNTGAVGTIEIGAHERSRKPGGRRKKFPDHFPVVRTIYELGEDERRCTCGAELHVIGQDLRRELERVETTVVHEICQKKYACRECEEGVRTAPGRERVIDKGVLGRGFLAQVIVDRFLNHLPYHRLEKKYASEGLDLSRSVLQRSMAKVGELLEPVWSRLREDVLASPALHTDDTPVTVAQHRDGGSKKGRVWIYLDLAGTHYYEFTENRKRDGPMRVLGDYDGYIHADAYGGYDQLYLPGGAIEVACFAHLRRKFVEAEASDPKIAKEALDRIRDLYKIERSIKGCDPDEKYRVRQELAKPLLAKLESWLGLQETRLLPKSPAAQAVGYAQRQWAAFERYIEDGRLSIDNNPAERALRPFAVGRKNWLFFQRESGGKTGAVLMSLLMSAKAIGLDPRTYFRDVLLRIAEEPDVAKLTPKGWKAHFAAAVAGQRQEILERLVGHSA